MAISDTITSMYANTSNAYDMLSNGTDLTGINKNLENLSSTIFEAFLEALRNPDTLFNNLPKTSGSGSNITLNGTAYAPMRITLNPTAISQDGTPTPSSPQDIHTISGNNSVVVEGKNISPINEKLITGTTGVSGTIGSFNGSVLVKDIPVEPNQTYIITMNKPTEISPRMMFYNEKMNATTNNSAYSEIINSNRGVQEIINENGNTNTTYQYMAVLLGNTTNYSQGQQVTINISQLMVRKSNTSTDYTPYVSQTAPINLGEYELGTIGNYSNEFVRSGGKQLFDSERTLGTPSDTAFSNATNRLFNYNEFVKGMTTNNYYSPNNISYVSISNNKLEIETTGGGYGVGMAVKTKPNTQYTISFNANPTNTDALAVSYYQSNGAYISNSSSLGNNYLSFTTPSNCDFILIILRPPKDTRTIYSNIMLNKGTTALPYVPYEKGWYYKQGIGKVVLDGTEDWQPATSVMSGTNRFYYSNSNVINDKNTGSDIVYILSNKFKGIGWSSMYGTDTTTTNAISLYSNTQNVNRIQIRIDNTLASDTATFKTYLGTNNATCYYVKETPTYTKITGELANQLEQVYKGMLSYDGTTNISQVNNDLAFVINASAITKLS